MRGHRPSALTITRRTTLATMGLVLFTACTGSSGGSGGGADVDAINDVTAIDSAENLKEAPMLAERVSSGDLPPVA